jgi:hypothetical protein
MYAGEDLSRPFGSSESLAPVTKLALLSERPVLFLSLISCSTNSTVTVFSEYEYESAILALSTIVVL